MDHGMHGSMSNGSSMQHMDHSSHGAHMEQMAARPSDGGMMHMEMYFHVGFQEVILFNFWKISSVEGLIGSMIGIFILSVLYESLKYLREFLFWKNYTSLQYRKVQGPVAKTNNDTTAAQVVNLVPDVTYNKWMPSLLSKHHILQTFLHIVQVFVSYLLMLIFMTYNVWLCLAVVLGAATGYFFFGWKKALFVDVTEHCH